MQSEDRPTSGTPTPASEPSLPSLTSIFEGKRILLTGSTGFLGKVVLATLLEKLPGIARIVCIVRAPSHQAAEDRFLKDVVASPALDAVRETHGLGLREHLSQKVLVRAGDVARERLGLDEAGFAAVAKDLDLVIHCAGLVDFVPPLDKGLASNVDGTQRVLELAKRAGPKRCAFLHVSTCFVYGDREGQVPEDLRANETPLTAKNGFDTFDARREVDEARKLVSRLLQDEIEDPATHAELWKEAEGNPRKAKRLAEVRSKRRLAEEGLARARRWGWPNTYTYTKALAERLVDAARPDLGPVAILRPAVVESALRFPFPGWNQGVNTCAPLMWMASRGLRYFPIDDHHNLDVIPVDLCVNVMVAISGALLANRAKPIYQVGSSAVNPLAIRRVLELTCLAYRKADLPESWLKKYLRKHTGGIPVSMGVYRNAGIPGLAKIARGIRGFLEKVPPPARRPAVRSALEGVVREAKVAEKKLEHASQVMELFLPFINGPKTAFRTDNAIALERSLAPGDRELFPYDPEKIDWRDYFLRVFIPGLERWTFPELKEREGSATDAAPLYASLVALLEDTCNRYPKRVALRRTPSSGEEEKLTYEELLSRTEAVAARLAGAGVKPGDRVALAAENRPAWVATFFGILRAGATCVPVDSATDLARLAPLARTSRARAVVVSNASEAAQRALAQSFASLEGKDGKNGKTAAAPPRLVAIDELTAPPAGERAPAVDPTKLAPAVLIYTSGTTGAPKGVLLSHRALAAQVRSLSQLYPLGPEDRALSVLPLHHAFELTCGLLLPLARGAAISYAREATADAIKEGLHRTRPTAMIGVPALFEAWHRQIHRAAKTQGSMAERTFDALIGIHRGFRKRTGFNIGSRLFPEIHRQFGGELRYAVCGGAALAREVTNTFHGLGIDLYEGYGLTEAGPVVCANRPQAGPKAGSVGEPIPGVQVKIQEPDGEGTGEVLVRSPALMDGYDQEPDVTKSVFLDGWLRTGDLGRLDAEGRVSIVGRSKDVIVDGAGNTVYPDEVEELYSGCPDVTELAVAGVPLRDEKEVVGALVLVKDGGAPGSVAETRERVRAFFREVSQGLPSAKRVKVLKFTTRPLPRNATRKVKRDEVARMLHDLARGEAAASPKKIVSARGQVARTLEEVAGVDAGALAPDSDLAQDLGLDSIAVADAISALAEATGRTAPPDLGRLQTVADLVRHFEDAPAAGQDALTTPLTTDPRPIVLPRAVRALGKEAIDAFIRLAFTRGFQTRISGTGNIPRHTQAIVVANHSSHLDVGLVRHALGSWGKGLISVGARDYFFKDRAVATYFENFTNVLAFDRRESIRESLSRVVALLESGHNVLIFPEGTRSVTGRLQAFKAGLGYLVATTGAGVLPVYLSGTFQAAPKGSLIPRSRRLEARIGGFMPASVLLAKAGGKLKRDKLQRISEIAREAIVALRDGVAFDVRSLPVPESESDEKPARSRPAKPPEARVPRPESVG
ncbi:AMP-binding protein [bacterium]|nr:AMP-binding protein [bacterium]